LPKHWQNKSTSKQQGGTERITTEILGITDNAQF